MNKNNTLDWEVIRRKIAGTLSEDEEKRLKEWAGKNVRRKKMIESAQRYYSLEELPLVDENYIDKAWEHFRASKQNKVRLFRRQLIRWGSVACLLLTLGSGWWLYNYNTLVIEPESLVSAVISPGSKKARLILSDGEVVDLHVTGSRRLTDRQANICLDSLGVTYEQSGGKEDIVFNTLSVPKGGEYSLTLCDGTRVWLNAMTDLTYPVAFTGGERRVKLNGEAYFEVARNEQKPFIVEVGNMNVEVLGTSFNLNAYADEPVVTTTLMTGKVRLAVLSGGYYVLSPSDQASFSRADGRMEMQQVNTSLYSAWRTGRFVFRDHSLKEIMRTLARWYDMEYEFAVPELENLCFYGTLNRYDNIEELLWQFEKTGKVQFQYQKKKIIIKK